VHGTNGRQVLVDNRFGRPAPFNQVSLEAADKSQIRVGVDKDLHIENFPENGLGEDENSFNQDKTLRLDQGETVCSGVGSEVVNGEVDGFARFEIIDMLSQEGGFQRIGVVKIDLRPLLVR
jgi:hypothetical protein